MSTDETHTALLIRIADALERLAPPTQKKTDLTRHEGYIWETEKQAFRPVDEIARLPLDSLQGIDQQKALLLENTAKFAEGLRANNALLWGARGTGKSSVLKAVHGHLLEQGLINPGELLQDSRSRWTAKIRADGSLISEDKKGSIHSVGADLQGLQACNGWTFWHYKSGNSLKPIDDLRQRLRPSN